MLTPGPVDQPPSRDTLATFTDEPAARRRLMTITLSLAVAALFEALTVLGTQDKTVRTASPWQDDPYDAVVSLAQFTVPMLGLVMGLRLLCWRLPGGPDRAHQIMRAAAVMTGIVAVTVGFEWAAVATGAHRFSWNGWTQALLAGLVATSLLTVIVVVLLVRCRYPRGSAGRWRHDWLGDLVLLGERLPVIRRWPVARAAAWVRLHAMRVFVTVSVLAATLIVAALAVGEQWTDPLLIGWALAVESTSNLAFCVISNTTAGFIARPPRTRVRCILEASVIVGCVTVQVSVAFRDTLWSLIGSGPLESVPVLAALTLGAGAVATLLTAAIIS